MLQLCFPLCVSFILKQALSKWQGKKMTSDSLQLVPLSNPKEKSVSLSCVIRSPDLREGTDWPCLNHLPIPEFVPMDWGRRTPNGSLGDTSPFGVGDTSIYPRTTEGRVE